MNIHLVLTIKVSFLYMGLRAEGHGVALHDQAVAVLVHEHQSTLDSLFHGLSTDHCQTQDG